jgi:hypothetical protein
MSGWQNGKSKKMECEKFQHNSVSTKNGVERMRGRVPFIPQEAKGSGLDQCQVLDY